MDELYWSHTWRCTVIGCRPLTELEIGKLISAFSKPRERIFFRLCLVTGFRPSEALSLKVADILGQERVVLQKRNTKGRLKSRSILVHPELREAIARYVEAEGLQPEDPLFKSREGGAVSRTQMWRCFREAVLRAGLRGKVALHSGRKTFAAAMYEHFDRDLVRTAKSLGHASINSTVSYLSFRTEELDRAVEMLPWVGLK